MEMKPFGGCQAMDGLVSALAACSALLFGAASQGASSDTQGITRSQTFVVQSMIDDRRAQIGSGVVVNRDGDILTVATAAHVVRSGAPLRILDVSRKAYYAVIDVRKLRDYDIALVRVRSQSDFTAAPAQFASPVAGEPVWIWGNSQNGFWNLATGTVQSTTARLPGERGAPRITISCERCGAGDSGAGVFGAGGRLIGILTAGWRVPGGPVAFVEVAPLEPIVTELAARDLLEAARVEP